MTYIPSCQVLPKDPVGTLCDVPLWTQIQNLLTAIVRCSKFPKAYINLLQTNLKVHTCETIGSMNFSVSSLNIL